MNPITNIKNQNKLNERELAAGTAGVLHKSWHAKYITSAWVFVGGLPYELNEGDVITIFSQ
jgi:RNA-binding motif X-linked protein 2